MPEYDPDLAAKVNAWTWNTAVHDEESNLSPTAVRNPGRPDMQAARAKGKHSKGMRSLLHGAGHQVKSQASDSLWRLNQRRQHHHQGGKPGAPPYPDFDDIVLPPDAQEFLRPAAATQTVLYQNTQNYYPQTSSKKKKVGFQVQEQAIQKSAYQRLEDRKVKGTPAWGSWSQHPDTAEAFRGNSKLLTLRLRASVWRLPDDAGAKGWGVLDKHNMSVVPASQPYLQRVLQALGNMAIYWRYPSGGRFFVMRDMEVRFNLGWDNWAKKVIAKDIEIAGSERSAGSIIEPTLPPPVPFAPTPVANPVLPALKRMKFSAVIESMPREGLGVFGWGVLRDGWQSWEGQAAHRQAKAALRGWTVYVPPNSVKRSRLAVGSRILCHFSWDPTHKVVFANHIRLQEDV